jgi:thiol-disulfide isomerase/thioredoxin
MTSSIGWRWLTALAAIGLLTLPGVADERTWKAAEGGFTVDAELLSVEDGKVRLRRADGKVIAVPLSKLSQADRKFAESQTKGHIGTDAKRDAKEDEASNDAIKEIADRFYADLRTTERQDARSTLTAEAKKLAEAGQSPLSGLPEPDQHKRAIQVGKIEVEGATAVAPVRVKAGGKSHKTKLHLRKEGDAWCVFAISAQFPDGEKTLNFEASVAAGQAEDPLAALVGQELGVTGLTLDGQPLDSKQFEGKVVLIDFWATWCGPCRAEMPNILANWNEHHDAGFEVIAISVDRDLEALKKFVIEEKPPWTVVADNHPQNRASMSAKLGIRGIPAFVLIGRDGKVAAINCRGKRLGQELTKLLGEEKRVAMAQ